MLGLNSLCFITTVLQSLFHTEPIKIFPAAVTAKLCGASEHCSVSVSTKRLNSHSLWSSQALLILLCLMHILDLNAH